MPFPEAANKHAVWYSVHIYFLLLFQIHPAYCQLYSTEGDLPFSVLSSNTPGNIF